ncbi:MAG: hypothetical protein ACRCXZ_01985, partial [Patescibacteria group bacterium]
DIKFWFRNEPNGKVLVIEWVNEEDTNFGLQAVCPERYLHRQPDNEKQLVYSHVKGEYVLVEIEWEKDILDYRRATDDIYGQTAIREIPEEQRRKISKIQEQYVKSDANVMRWPKNR